MAGESVHSFPWGGKKKKREKKMLPRREYARKNFKTCDKNLILFLQKGTIYFVP